MSLDTPCYIWFCEIEALFDTLRGVYGVSCVSNCLKTPSLISLASDSLMGFLTWRLLQTKLPEKNYSLLWMAMFRWHFESLHSLSDSDFRRRKKETRKPVIFILLQNTAIWTKIVSVILKHWKNIFIICNSSYYARVLFVIR